jgi:hypothetical protein
VKTVAVVQSNYIPWKGYFDLIRRSDEFVLYDDVQFTRRDWRNRNRIKTKDGPKWLTIPVEVSGRFTQTIKDVRVSDPSWAERHWKTLVSAYGRVPRFGERRASIEALYASIDSSCLSTINRHFLEGLCPLLGITTPLRWSMEFELPPGRSERLLAICRQCDATTYLSGPAAASYLDVELFERSGVSVEFMRYDGYPEYSQPYPPFEHGVSVLDLLLCAGTSAGEYLLPARVR